MSARQDIIDALDARLQTILTTNGYGTNAGQHVYEHRATPLNETEMPGIVFRDSETVTADTFGEELHTLEIILELHAAGAGAQDTVRSIAADVIAALGTDPTFGGLAEDVEIPREESLVLEAAEQFYAAGTLTVTIQYVTDLYSA